MLDMVIQTCYNGSMTTRFFSKNLAEVTRVEHQSDRAVAGVAERCPSIPVPQQTSDGKEHGPPLQEVRFEFWSVYRPSAMREFMDLIERL